MADPAGSTPVPDPTVLTTQQLYREIAAVAESMEIQFESLKELIEEKFRSVDQQLDLVERQRVEQKSDTKAAVDAALTAQKEAVKEQTTASATAIGKSESGMKEQLSQLSTNFTTAISGLQVIINDMKDRVVKLESYKLNLAENKQDFRASTAIIISMGFLVIAIIGAVLGVVLGK
jgi:hypothetical protein